MVGGVGGWGGGCGGGGGGEGGRGGGGEDVREARLQPSASRQLELGNALQQLQRELIEPARVAISPAACFALLTPLIDARLGNLQQQLGAPA